VTIIVLVFTLRIVFHCEYHILLEADDTQ